MYPVTGVLDPVEETIEKLCKLQPFAGTHRMGRANFGRRRHNRMIPLKSGFAIFPQIDLATVDFDVPGITRFAVERFWDVIMHERVSGKRVATGADRMTRKWPQ